MESLIERLRALAEAYPVGVFPALTKEQTNAHPEIVTRASASMGRHFSPVFTQAADEIERLRSLLREVMAADWRTHDNTLWPRLVAATSEQGANTEHAEPPTMPPIAKTAGGPLL